MWRAPLCLYVPSCSAFYYHIIGSSTALITFLRPKNGIPLNWTTYRSSHAMLWHSSNTRQQSAAHMHHHNCNNQTHSAHTFKKLKTYSKESLTPRASLVLIVALSRETINNQFFFCLPHFMKYINFFYSSIGSSIITYRLSLYQAQQARTKVSNEQSSSP